jgi:hypothetical protein
MTTNRKNYKILEELKIVERFKNGKSKGSLFCKCGIPEGPVCSWMREEDKLHLFVDSIEDDIGLQRKNTRLHENSYIDKCLYYRFYWPSMQHFYKWFLQKRSETVVINCVISIAQAVEFSKLLSTDGTFKTS